MRRVLVAELRRSAAPGAGVLVLAAGFLLGYGDGGAGSGGWMSLAVVQSFGLMLMWPVALAAGAWQSRREHRTGVLELVATTARPGQQRVLPVCLAMGTTVVGAYAALAVLTALLDGTGGYLPPGALVILALGAVWLASGVWLGLALGRLLPSVVTAPALAVAGLGLLIGLQSLPAGARWVAMLASPAMPLAVQGVHDHDFLELSARLDVAHGLLGVAVAVTAVVLLAAGSRRARAAALLPARRGGGRAGGRAPRDGSPGVDGVVAGVGVDRVAQELVCTPDTPQVCVARVHADLLPTITAPARDVLRGLARLTPAPTRAEEDVTPHWVHAPGPGGRPDTVTFTVFSGNRGLRPDAVASRMAAQLGTGAWAGCSAPFAALDAADAWLRGHEPPAADPERPDVARGHQLWQDLRGLPDPVALQRVSAVRVAALGCARDLDRVLAG